MYWFVINAPTLAEATSMLHATTDYNKAHDFPKNYAAICRSHGINTMDDANKLADLCNADKVNSRTWIATDAGEWVSPRYDVMHIPSIGDDVSYAFNGDYYPCGKVTKITTAPYRKIEATDKNGKVCVFWRQRQSGCWKYNKTWNLIAGVHKKLNPEF